MSERTDPVPRPRDLGPKPGIPATDVESIRQAMGRASPVIDEYAPSHVREVASLAVAKAIDKKPLVVIAEAIIDLRYTVMMQFDAELAQLDNKDEETKGKFALLLNEWAHETVSGKKESPG